MDSASWFGLRHAWNLLQLFRHILNGLGIEESQDQCATPSELVGSKFQTVGRLPATGFGTYEPRMGRQGDFAVVAPNPERRRIRNRVNALHDDASAGK